MKTNFSETPASLDSTVGSKRPSPILAGYSAFDSLRAVVEGEVAPPTVIAITSALSEDGRELASRGLASSLAATGYATLLLDTSLSSRSLFTPPAHLSFDDIARQLTAPNPAGGRLAFLTLSDAALQRTTSLRRVRSAFEILRSKFDYIVINTGGQSNAFATAVLNGADSILVTVKLGRRERRKDAALSRKLLNMGSRFLGVIALEPTTITDPSIAAVPYAFSNTPRNSPAHVEKGLLRPEAA